jgi:hypothetical protein
MTPKLLMANLRMMRAMNLTWTMNPNRAVWPVFGVQCPEIKKFNLVLKKRYSQDGFSVGIRTHSYSSNKFLESHH